VDKLINIVAVGDLMLGDHPVRLGHGVRSHIEEIGAENLFSKVVQLFEGNDIVFGNLEVAHSDHGLNEKKIESMEFRGSPSTIPSLEKAGFNVLNFANNHCMEHGTDAFWETVNLLHQNNIYAAGINMDYGCCKPVEFMFNDIKVVLLSYSLRSENYHKENNVPYALKSEDNIIEEVRYFSKAPNRLIISLHWGEEFMDYPSPKQVLFAHKLVEAGANLIIGHHPHVLQGVERYRDAIIAYSLGNFIFDMWQRNTRETIILQAQWSKTGINIKLIPIYINSFFQPEPIDGKKGEYFLRKVEFLNNKIRQKYKDLDTWDDKIINLVENQYNKYARQKAMRHRLENYFYFLAHLYRYERSVIMQSLSRFLERRFERTEKIDL
jgi:gamma-polyglutamate biosynthesis protein CapA